MKEDDPHLSALIRQKAPRYEAPAQLRTQLREALAKTGSSPERKGWQVRLPVFLAGLVGSATLAAVLAVIALLPRTGDPLLDELVANHVRSLQVDHLTDVNSSDQHTVKPWFNGKLDFSPPVQDLGAAGFPLVGARIDYAAQHTAAALVYRHRQHPINLFVWPDAGGDTEPQGAALRGYHIVSWRSGGLAFRAVSDMNPGELRDFANTLRAAKPAG